MIALCRGLELARVVALPKANPAVAAERGGVFTACSLAGSIIFIGRVIVPILAGNCPDWPGFSNGSGTLAVLSLAVGATLSGLVAGLSLELRVDLAGLPGFCAVLVALWFGGV